MKPKGNQFWLVELVPIDGPKRKMVVLCWSPEKNGHPVTRIYPCGDEEGFIIPPGERYHFSRPTPKIKWIRRIRA